MLYISISVEEVNQHLDSEYIQKVMWEHPLTKAPKKKTVQDKKKLFSHNFGMDPKWDPKDG